MKSVSRLIASPRAAKRFINVYRLLRVSVSESQREDFVGDPSRGQHRPVLLLLAILIGYPMEATEILRGLIEHRPNQPWWTYVDGFRTHGELSTVSAGEFGTIEQRKRPVALKAFEEGHARRWHLLLEKLDEIRKADTPLSDRMRCAMILYGGHPRWRATHFSRDVCCWREM
jgi:hypothetical protein